MTVDEERLKADFLYFAACLWIHLGLPQPTKAQYDICRFLAKGPKRRMVQAFRGVGKSWLTSAYVLWRLLCDPNERIMVVSASKDRADAFSTFVRRLITDVEWLRHLTPDPKKGQRDSALLFDVGPSDPAQAPSMRAVGITGQMTGGRATLIVADDVETPKNSMTQLMRERLAELVKEFDAILVPGPDSEIVYLGTPQCEDSVYTKLPARGYVVRIWPARRPAQAWLEHYADKLTPWAQRRIQGLPEGSSMDPERFTDKDLAERELSYGRSSFALQFMLDTRLADANRFPLKLSDLIIMAVDKRKAPLSVTWGADPENVINELPNVGLKGDRLYRPIFKSPDFLDYQGSFMYIDPSGRGADETAYAVVKILNSQLYLTAVGGFSEGYSDDVLEQLAKIARDEDVNLVQVEPNMGDGMFLKLFQPWLLKHHKCKLEDAEWVTSQKEKRIIDTLEPVMNQHRLVVAESVIKSDVQQDDPYRQLCYQLTRITKERGSLKHDDRLDAVAAAVGYWIKQLARSTEAAAKQSQEKMMDKELKKFAGHVFAAGRPPQQKSRKLSSRFTM